MAAGDAIRQLLPPEEVQLTAAQFGMLAYKLFLNDEAAVALFRSSPLLRQRFVMGLGTKGSAVADAYAKWNTQIASDLSQIKRDLAVAKVKTQLERELYTLAEAKSQLARDVAALAEIKADLSQRSEVASASAASEPVFEPPPPLSQMPSLSFDTSAAWPHLNFSAT